MKEDYNAKVVYNKDIATNYEKDRINEPIWEIEQKFMEKYAKSLPENAEIIDIPVGTGRFFEIYKLQKLNVFAYDISDDMLEIAKNKAYQLNLNLLEIKKANITTLNNLKHASFTICWRLFHLLPSNIAEKAIKELCFITKEEIVIQIFNEFSQIKLLKNKILSMFKKLTFKNELSKKSIKQKSWEHIENYPHTANFIKNNFKKNGFEIKEKIHLSNYENTPVYVYIFKKINEYL